MTAIVKQVPAQITITGPGKPFTKADIAAEHEQDRSTLKDWAHPTPVTSDHDLVALDANLTDVARLRDDLIERRQAPLRDVKAAIKEVESWFLAYVKDCEAAIDGLKRAKADYLTAKAEAAQKARQEAQRAAEAGNSAAVLASVQLAQSLEAAPSGTRYRWEATVTNEAMIPDEYWIVDRARLDQIARDMGSAEEQSTFVPGVTFQRVAVVQARRK